MTEKVTIEQLRIMENVKRRIRAKNKWISDAECQRQAWATYKKAQKYNNQKTTEVQPNANANANANVNVNANVQ